MKALFLAFFFVVIVGAQSQAGHREGSPFSATASATCPQGTTCSTKKLKKQCLNEARKTAESEAQFECADLSTLGLPRGFAADVESFNVVKENENVTCEYKGTFICELPTESEARPRGTETEQKNVVCEGPCKSSDADKCTRAAAKDAEVSLRSDCIDAGGVPGGRYITIVNSKIKPGETKLFCEALVGITCRR